MSSRQSSHPSKSKPAGRKPRRPLTPTKSALRTRSHSPKKSVRFDIPGEPQQKHTHFHSKAPAANKTEPSKHHPHTTKHTMAKTKTASKGKEKAHKKGGGKGKASDKSSNKKSARAEKRDAGPSTSADDDDGDDWEDEEDGMICLLRKMGVRSRDMAPVLAPRTAAEIRQRARHLDAAGRPLTTSGIAELYRAHLEETPRFRGYGVCFYDGGRGITLYPAGGGGADEDSTSTSTTSTSSTTSSRSSSSSSSEAEESDSSDSSDSDSDSDSDSASSDSDADSAESARGGPPTLIDALARRFPGRRRLRPDAFWTPAACRALSVLEARYAADKWLHIQAELANLAGFAAEPEMIEAKFNEGGGAGDDGEEEGG
ncbi:hypothetical protein GGS23DRAFT_616158 [Durotheca rogersii]|uniref:uncharacterized protein n=1 Tax=Durotheca rogersii TaxID=419775 RepID=UPI00221E7ADE|nr:uncharacterized protein GGS23DRAFT_616158 [Durotheca rogersii]KAI5859473.1 hypothetical protein GGS23DRAFT_616158 [Durotheca rogersii]